MMIAVGFRLLKHRGCVRHMDCLIDYGYKAGGRKSIDKKLTKADVSNMKDDSCVVCYCSS